MKSSNPMTLRHRDKLEFELNKKFRNVKLVKFASLMVI